MDPQTISMDLQTISMDGFVSFFNGLASYSTAHTPAYNRVRALAMSLAREASSTFRVVVKLSYSLTTYLRVQSLDTSFAREFILPTS